MKEVRGTFYYGSWFRFDNKGFGQCPNIMMNFLVLHFRHAVNSRKASPETVGEGGVSTELYSAIKNSKNRDIMIPKMGIRES